MPGVTVLGRSQGVLITYCLSSCRGLFVPESNVTQQEGLLYGTPVMSLGGSLFVFGLINGYLKEGPPPS